MTQDIYTVTGKGSSGGGAGVVSHRSTLQQHERFWQQPNNATNEYTLNLFWREIGYNAALGYPREGLVTDILFMGQEANQPMEWTLTTENDIVTQIWDGQWWSYSSKDQLWVSRGTQWYAPSTAWSCLVLWLCVPLYLFLAWYLAHVFGEGEGRSGHRCWFLFSRAYWLGYSDEQGKAMLEAEIGEDMVHRARQHSLERQSIQTVKLSKSYPKQTALRELTIEMRNGEVSTLLGHNGAGKTTVVNLLTGLHRPTHGGAFVGGRSLRDDIAQIQQVRYFGQGRRSFLQESARDSSALVLFSVSMRRPRADT